MRRAKGGEDGPEAGSGAPAAPAGGGWPGDAVGGEKGWRFPALSGKAIARHVTMPGSSAPKTEGRARGKSGSHQL